MDNETYKSADFRLYESKGICPLTIQRAINIEQRHYSSCSSSITIKVEDYLTDFQWEGNLAQLIDILKSQTTVTTEAKA